MGDGGDEHDEAHGHTGLQVVVRQELLKQRDQTIQVRHLLVTVLRTRPDVVAEQQQVVRSTSTYGARVQIGFVRVRRRGRGVNGHERVPRHARVGTQRSRQARVKPRPVFVVHQAIVQHAACLMHHQADEAMPVLADAVLVRHQHTSKHLGQVSQVECVVRLAGGGQHGGTHGIVHLHARLGNRLSQRLDRGVEA